MFQHDPVAGLDLIRTYCRPTSSYSRSLSSTVRVVRFSTMLGRVQWDPGLWGLWTFPNVSIRWMTSDLLKTSIQVPGAGGGLSNLLKTSLEMVKNIQIWSTVGAELIVNWVWRFPNALFRGRWTIGGFSPLDCKCGLTGCNHKDSMRSTHWWARPWS